MYYFTDRDGTTNQFQNEFNALLPETKYSLSVKYSKESKDKFIFSGKKFYAQYEFIRNTANFN